MWPWLSVRLVESESFSILDVLKSSISSLGDFVANFPHFYTLLIRSVHFHTCSDSSKRDLISFILHTTFEIFFAHERHLKVHLTSLINSIPINCLRVVKISSDFVFPPCK